jgi:hypothetical protein
MGRWGSGGGEKERWGRVKAVSTFVPHSATAVQKGRRLECGDRLGVGNRRHCCHLGGSA